MKYWLIQIEGVDKTGKDLLCEYIKQISNYKYVVYSRGIVSLLAYTERYNRNYKYNIESTVNKNWVFIYLTANENDLKIRYKLTNHNYEELKDDKQFFEKYLKDIEKIGCPIFKYNVSEMQYYDIATDIIKKLNELEEN